MPLPPTLTSLQLRWKRSVPAAPTPTRLPGATSMPALRSLVLLTTPDLSAVLADQVWHWLGQITTLENLCAQLPFIVCGLDWAAAMAVQLACLSRRQTLYVAGNLDDGNPCAAARDRPVLLRLVLHGLRPHRSCQEGAEPAIRWCSGLLPCMHNVWQHG